MNVVLAGGNTLFPGLQERLAKEMSSRETDPNLWTVRVVADPERRDAVWIGGSILASLSTFKDESISREGYSLISRFLLEFSVNFVSFNAKSKGFLTSKSLLI